MQQNDVCQTGGEISPQQILDFFVRNRWVILGLIGVGLLISSLFVIMAPKRFEARWQLRMAMSGDNTIETPAALIQRLRIPTSYNSEVRLSCEMPGSGEFGDNLDGKLEISVVKGVSDSVDMRLGAANPDKAKFCAEAIAAMIIAQQRELTEQGLAGHQLRLIQYQEAFAEEQQQLDRIKKTEIGHWAYMSRLDKLSWLRGQIDQLQIEAMSIQPAKLVAPIYAPSSPVPPKVRSPLLSGGLIGFMAGVMLALFRERLRKRA